MTYAPASITAPPTPMISTEITSPGSRGLMGWLAPVGPLAMAGWSLAIPYDLVDDTAVWIPKMADLLAVQLSFWMMLIFVLAVGLGVVVTGAVARAGSRRVGTVGMVLALAGFATMGYGGIAYDAIAASSLRSGVDPATIERILAAADLFTAPSVGASVFIPLSFVGVILLAVALWRGRLVARWVPVIMIIAVPLILVGPMISGTINALGFVVLALAFGAAGRRFAGVRATQ